MIFLAHGIGGVRDLPVPESFFFTTAAIVLVVSFVLLGLLWKRPLLEAHADGRRLPRVAQRRSSSRLALRVVLQVVSVALLVVTLATALFGTTTELLNFAPTFVYVIFWLGSSAALDPVRERVARAQPVARHRRRRPCGCSSSEAARRGPFSSGSGRWGRYPAAAALFSFVALELANPRPAYPRTLAIATALYSYWALAGMAVYGREAWTRGGEGFAVAFELLSRIAPFAVRDGARRRALAVHRARRRRARSAGRCVFVAVMLGSTSFDGFSRTITWQNLIGDIRADLAGLVAAHGRSRDDARRTSRG